MNDELWEKLYEHAKHLVDSGKNFEFIENDLHHKTDDKQAISEIISQLKKVQHAVKAKNGRSKLLFGALFLVVGFVITVFNFHANQSFTIVMYSFTSIGLVLMCWGLYDIIG